jgi:hypothetical protein
MRGVAREVGTVPTKHRRRMVAGVRREDARPSEGAFGVSDSSGLYRMGCRARAGQVRGKLTLVQRADGSLGPAHSASARDDGPQGSGLALAASGSELIGVLADDRIERSEMIVTAWDAARPSSP